MYYSSLLQLGKIFSRPVLPQVQIIRKDSQSHDPVEVKRLQSGLEVLGYRKAPIHEPASQPPYVDNVDDQTILRQSKSKGQ